MKTKILQSIADFIIKMIEKAESEDAINFFYERGIALDEYAMECGIELE